MWELDYKESWAPKNWCFWTVVLEKTLESPLDCKEIQPVNSKENQSWIFIGRTDAEAEAPILWPPDVKSWLIWKDSDAGKDWRQEKGMTEDEMGGWHHWLNGHEWASSGSWWWTGKPGVLQSNGVTKSRTWLSDWSEMNWTSFFPQLFLHCSPVAYRAPPDLGSLSFSVLSSSLFILFMGFSRQEYWSGIAFGFGF